MMLKRTLLAAAVGAAISTSAFADLRFWTTEEQPDRLAKQQAMAEQFKARQALQLK